MDTIDYDTSRSVIEALSRNRGTSRDVHWFGEKRRVGVARGERDRVEIFLPGEELATTRPAVTHLMHQGTWSRADSTTDFEAARLMLPPGDQYDAIAATVVVELVRLGLEDDRQEAFSRCEALIEVALIEADLAVESVLGLWGELYVLSLWLDQSSSSLTPLDAWCGYRPSARDFSAGRLGVEVKTTLRATSSHQVAGVHQTEPTPADDRPIEEELWLVSIGLQPEEQGLSVLHLVDRLDQAIRAQSPDRADELHVHISDYAGRSTGYSRFSENQPQVLRQTYGVSFVRGYDMADPSIEVLRLADVQARPHIQTDSVRFRINLPTRVRGDLNPIAGPAATIRELRRRQHL